MHRKERALRGALVVSVLATLAACTPQPPSLEQIQERHELKVVTLNAPTSYYLGAHGAEGLEFELARAFAEELGVTLVIYPVPTVSAMKAELAAGRADIAAAHLTADESWEEIGQPAKPYAHIPQLVVYGPNKPRPRSTLQIESARLSVRAGTPQEQILERLKRTVAPNLQWTATAPHVADPLEDVESGQADYAIVDAREYSFSRHLYPHVKVGFELPTRRPVQWVVRRGAHDLSEAVANFFRTMERSGRLAQLIHWTSGEARSFDFLESRKFQEHMQTRLPRFRPWFEQAAEQTGVDWRLLAAMGYQESNWDPAAESHAGALGVMMLTASTAEAMGVKDRKNAKQSILAGARYYVEVLKKVPARIPEPDRTWMAVAAYNVGFGHLEDARILAQSRGKNPDSWEDVREHLPLLAQERWYTQAKRGYARGWEPVQFVDRVQGYLKLLEWQPTDTLTAGEPTRIEAPPIATAPTEPPSEEVHVSAEQLPEEQALAPGA
jgi:membrane-bound lytic murein transglycosylase F